ncbi:Peptide chain release factor N(5)-glutamine methyltransferase [Mesoflavibacter sp. HG96]|uniref:peptide chain release factor N(5)-glutamine methyltransferase n=1 Tax=Mesoflavibacter TaxID=444051 RepID=UPI000D109449|nr:MULTISPECIES: peptide chain release factor N(5)-glutamine methyltransferase [Mesoflavibacter]QIJ90531.1 Peptide chain release factor N(5)-glutamine methyltransferase [Mesoflavibacter sp. HG96]QIJ93259.1 Peptide chain release factor N(5)-glutamine methyltransferase [Mesoflavibacter sp. HG37]
MKLKDLKYKFHEHLDAIYGKEEVQTFFFMLTEYYNAIKRLDLALNTELTIENDCVLKYESALEALKNHEPIQYIIGQTEFYGLPFYVNENTLIPRPETEELVELILSNTNANSQLENFEGNNQFNILDIGTGTGCIAISLAKQLPNANVSAIDVSAKALEIANKNAELNQVDINFIENDILKICDSELDSANKFDIIVSNPPYVRQLEKQQMQDNVLNHEPHLALFVDDENPLIFYRAITQFATKNLNPNGELYFEINEYLGKEMMSLLEEFGFKDIQLKQDLFGKDRMVKGTLRI